MYRLAEIGHSAPRPASLVQQVPAPQEKLRDVRGLARSSARFSAVRAEPDASDDLDAWWRRLPQRPVTASLLALCVLAYAATMVAVLVSAPDPWATATRSLWSLEGNEEILIRLGALDLTRVWVDGEWWRVVTSGLLHGSLIHLVLNMMALGSIGDWVEHAWGSWRSAMLFVLTSVAGCLASLLWCESRMVVGASAGVLGQAGALWVARQFGGPPLQAALAPVSVLSLGILILLCLFLGTVIPGIAQAGHVGGLGMGLILGALMIRRWPRWVHIFGGLVVAAMLLSLAALARAPAWDPQYHALLGFRAGSEGDTTTATRHFLDALERDPDNTALQNAIAYQFALDGIELDQAEALIRRALSLEPTNANYLDTLGWILCRRGEPDLAKPLLYAAVFLADESVPEIESHVGLCASSAI